MPFALGTVQLLNMKALCCFETSETTHPTRGCLIPEDLNPQYIKI